MSKFELVAQDLLEKIRNGVYPANSKLPTTVALCSEYHVSKVTIKQAMDVLEDHGMVSRRQGSGVYVKGVEPLASPVGHTWSPQRDLAGFTAERSDLGETVTSEVRDFSVIHPSEAIQRALHLRPDEFAYHVCRVRSSDGVPLVVEYAYLPIKVAPELSEADIAGSFYAYVEKKLRLRIGSAHRTVRAVLPTKEEAEWLGITETTPLLEVSQVRYLDDGRPLECSTARHCGDYELHSIANR